MTEYEKYLNLLSEKFPNEQAVCKEIINLSAIMNLPKGTEHFMSDLHGEYEAFCHILNNCSGVIREKVELLFSETLSTHEQQELCTLIYYPKEKLKMLHDRGPISNEWYRMTFEQLIQLAKLLSSKYTRSKVRKALPEDFAYIIDELLHVQKDEDNNQVRYHQMIMDTILQIKITDDFIIALAALVKRLAVDHLHIVGDIFDRGASADKILDLLMQYHSLDIEWGNHDILWMGAAQGSRICVANVLFNSLKRHNTSILENAYGISLRNLVLFAEKHYSGADSIESAFHAVSVILFKLEGQVIKAHPDYDMQDRMNLSKINWDDNTITVDGKAYPMKYTDFPTVDRGNLYELSEEETRIMDEITDAFINSRYLQRHISFLYKKGSMYRIYNGNLLYHGCIPMDAQGNFEGVRMDGRIYQGKDYLDYVDQKVRSLRYGEASREDLDFFWYLWSGYNSPLSGRRIRLFEKTYLSDPASWVEAKNYYYNFYAEERTCNMILREFGLYSEYSHIINGHTPVKTVEGEQPDRAKGKLIVIDGGFCKDYHKTTGIAGYTLIYSSHGLSIKAHQPFESVEEALLDNRDIESVSRNMETVHKRILVRDTDYGKQIEQDIEDLQELLQEYRIGHLKERYRH